MTSGNEVKRRIRPSITAPGGRNVNDDDPKLRRRVEVPPTVGDVDTTLGDEVPLNKSRSDFREEGFTRLLRQHGKRVVWRKALLCPCATAETDQIALDCPDCGADGYVYVDPIVLAAHMAQFDAKTTVFEKYGLFQEGSVQITVEAKYRLGFRDAVEMVDAVLPFNELVTKGNRRGRRQLLPEGVDAFRYRAQSIGKVLAKVGSGLVALEAGVHYWHGPEGWLHWHPRGHALVPDGAKYSVHYDYHPVYVIVSHQHATRDDVSGRKTPPDRPRAISLPIQALAKLDYIVNPYTVPSLDTPFVPDASGIGRSS